MSAGSAESSKSPERVEYSWKVNIRLDDGSMYFGSVEILQHFKVTTNEKIKNLV